MVNLTLLFKHWLLHSVFVLLYKNKFVECVSLEWISIYMWIYTYAAVFSECVLVNYDACMSERAPLNCVYSVNITLRNRFIKPLDCVLFLNRTSLSAQLRTCILIPSYSEVWKHTTVFEYQCRIYLYYVYLVCTTLLLKYGLPSYSEVDIFFKQTTYHVYP